MELTFKISAEEAIAIMDWWRKCQKEDRNEHEIRFPSPAPPPAGDAFVKPEYYETPEIPKDWVGYRVDPIESLMDRLDLAFMNSSSMVHVDKGDFVSLYPVGSFRFRLISKTKFKVIKDRNPNNPA